MTSLIFTLCALFVLAGVANAKNVTDGFKYPGDILWHDEIVWVEAEFNGIVNYDVKRSRARAAITYIEAFELQPAIDSGSVKVVWEKWPSGVAHTVTIKMQSRKSGPIRRHVYIYGRKIN